MILSLFYYFQTYLMTNCVQTAPCLKWELVQIIRCIDNDGKVNIIGSYMAL